MKRDSLNNKPQSILFYRSQSNLTKVSQCKNQFLYKLNFLYKLVTKMNQQESSKIGRVCNHILRTKDNDQNFGNLYLGGVGSLDPQVISHHKISAVLTIIDNYMYEKKNIKQRVENLHIHKYKWVDLLDDDEADISKHFQQCYEFIQTSLLQHNVLVHCQAGISRSATIVIFYVMKKLNLPLDLANKLVASKRWHISPNQTFWKSLQQKQEELQSSSDNKATKIKDPQSEFRTEKYPQKFANHIVCLNNEATYQKRNLFLGQYSILKSHFLKSLGIKSVISVVQESYYKRMKIKQIIQHEGIQNHLWLNIKDDPNQNQNLASFFQHSFQFINQNLEKGNVLVHCQAGVSRSATVVIAFLIKKFKVDFSEALSFVQSKRKVVNPNQGFKLSLIQYSEKLALK